MNFAKWKKKPNQMGMNNEEINRRAAEQAKKLLSELKGNLEEKKEDEINKIQMERKTGEGIETQTLGMRTDSQMNAGQE